LGIWVVADFAKTLFISFLTLHFGESFAEIGILADVFEKPVFFDFLLFPSNIKV